MLYISWKFLILSCTIRAENNSAAGSSIVMYFVSVVLKKVQTRDFTISPFLEWKTWRLSAWYGQFTLEIWGNI